jgi:hypothetical protein
MTVAVNTARFGARDAQPLDDLMGGAGDILKGLFDKPATKELPAFAQAAIEDQKLMRSAAARIFAPGSEGEQLLDYLCDAMIRRPVFVTQLGVDPMQALSYGAFREGQAAAIFYLLALVAEGRSEQPPQREGNHAHKNTRVRIKRRQPRPRRRG